VRRRVGLAEFEGAADVLSVLADDRLVTIGEGEVEVAHEALLREWPRLRGWLDEDAQGRRLHLHLRDAARSWDAAGRDAGELYRGARLAAVLDWSGAHTAELNAAERAFLAESRAASQRAQRRLRVLLAGVAALLALAVVAGVVALEQRGNARTEAIEADAQRVSAEAQRLGAGALLEDDLDRSLLLARQGVALDDSVQTRGNLLAALLKSPAAIGVLHGDGDRLIGIDLSPDERTLAFIDNGGTLSFVDTPTRRPVGPSVTVGGHVGTIIDAQVRLDHLRFSPDGSTLAVGGGEPVVLDARTHRRIARLRFRHDGFIYGLRFSPDGRTLFAAIALPSVPANIIQRYDARTGQPVGGDRQVSPDLLTLMITRDGRQLVVNTGEEAVIHDTRTLRPLRRWPVPAEETALSPDDRTMIAGALDGSVRFLDLVTGEVKLASGRHDRGVVRAAFSPDGQSAITAGDDGHMIVWDVEQASARETLEGHTGQITGLAITHAGQTLYSSSLDSRVFIWDLAGARRLGRPFTTGPDNPEGPRYALSPDGRTLAVGQRDGSVTLTDPTTLRRIARFPVVPKGPVRGMGYVPGGKLLFLGGENGFASLVDPRGGRIVKRLRGHRDRVFTPSFSADGRTMATASGFNSVRLWALPSGRPVGRPLRGPPDIGHISLSPDGRTLAVTRPPDGGVEIRDVPTLRRRTTLSDSETVWDIVRFTPDGRFLLGGSWKGWAQLWSTNTWKPASRRFTAHAGRVESQSISPDGHTLATGGPDGTIRLWDLRTQQPLGAPLPGLPNRPVAPQFTPDGAHLLVLYGEDGRAYRWDVRPSSWARHACAVAGRTLTRTEWNDALPERDYAPACKR
jgi:WD40 repeat protein